MHGFFVIRGVSAKIAFAGVTVTNWSMTTRYLELVAVLVFTLLAFFVGLKERAYLVLIGILILSRAIAVTYLGAHLKASEHTLSDYMKSNITFAYSDYWDANTLKYLSNEQVIVLPVIFNDTTVILHEWDTSERGFDEQPTEY